MKHGIDVHLNPILWLGVSTEGCLGAGFVRGLEMIFPIMIFGAVFCCVMPTYGWGSKITPVVLMSCHTASTLRLLGVVLPVPPPAPGSGMQQGWDSPSSPSPSLALLAGIK